MDELDRQLQGGLPAGSVTAIEAPPGSQGHLLLHELTAVRGTIWISYARLTEAIRASLEDTPSTSGDCTIRRVSDETPLEDTRKLLTAVPDRSNIILDPVDVLESSVDALAYRTFLNDLQQHVLERESLAILFCPRGDSRPALRDATKYVADVVFELEVHSRGDTVENFLRVPKLRRGECPTDIIKLELSSDVSIDISRDIA